jgi:pyruvate-formate lyase-activating enzyme
MAENVNKETTAVLAGGGVEYSIDEAAIEIDELIATLEAMKEDGVEHVVMSSGNYRGAQWSSIRGDWSWASEG